MKEYYHTDKNGKKWKLAEMSTQHLVNTIRHIKKKAEEGILIQSGGGNTHDEYWYDCYKLYDDDAKRYLGYQHYRLELLRRGKSCE